MLRSVFRSNSILVQGIALPQRRLASALVQKFESAVDSLPHREAVRYVEKNYKWTISQFNVRLLSASKNLFPN
ncbi:hypothetical protein EON65_09070 [archaeon]|nr:MAG: hypothetical protein EON65_09070 [archaeon]